MAVKVSRKVPKVHLALIVGALVLPYSARAQSADRGGAKTGDEDDLSKQLEQVLESPATPAETPRAQAPTGSGLANPDISLVFDGTAGAATEPRLISSGDDPVFGGPPDKGTGGVTLQELEIGFQASVDPYFLANAFLAIPNLESLEVEEAYALTTALPAGLQLKAGVFRSAAGRQNEQHLHQQDFSLRPLVNAAYLGEDGFRPPGLQVSWLAPLSFFLRLTGEVSSPAPGSSPTFGGALRSAPALLANVKTFASLSESWSLFVGGTVAAGHGPPPGFAPGATLEGNGPRTVLGAADLYLKFASPNHVLHYFSGALQAEYFLRRTSRVGSELPDAALDGGFYAQVVVQVSRRWHAGVRFDRLGMPASRVQGRADRYSVMAMMTPSEFSRIRLQLDRERVGSEDASQEALLLLEYSIGAHGAHPF